MGWLFAPFVCGWCSTKTPLGFFSSSLCLSLFKCQASFAERNCCLPSTERSKSHYSTHVHNYWYTSEKHAWLCNCTNTGATVELPIINHRRRKATKSNANQGPWANAKQTGSKHLWYLPSSTPLSALADCLATQISTIRGLVTLSCWKAIYHQCYQRY